MWLKSQPGTVPKPPPPSPAAHPRYRAGVHPRPRDKALPPPVASHHHAQEAACGPSFRCTGHPSACPGRQLSYGLYPQQLPTPSVPTQAKMELTRGRMTEKVYYTQEGCREEGALEWGLSTFIGQRGDPSGEETPKAKRASFPL